MNKRMTYKSSGVDISKASIFKSKIKPLVRKSFRKEVLGDIGGFGSFFRFPKEKYKDPVLVSSSDGVGTKLKVAVLADKHDTVGIDAVAMNVNDILCVGAEPLFFLDYIAFSKLDSDVLVDVVKGINHGCVQAGCSLIGGETAQMPGMYKDDDYDVAGFCVGVVERKKIIDGSEIKAGDAVIGLESNGIHSNGYSLVRRVLSENELRRMSKELLKPTRIYVKPIIDLLGVTNRKLPFTVKGIAHITGGAFYDKISRILPQNANASIYKENWRVPDIFRLIQSKGNIADREMYHTFNMGIGMVVICSPDNAPKLTQALPEARIIGEIVKKTGNARVIIDGVGYRRDKVD